MPNTYRRNRRPRPLSDAQRERRRAEQRQLVTDAVEQRAAPKVGAGTCAHAGTFTTTRSLFQGLGVNDGRSGRVLVGDMSSRWLWT